MELALFSTSKFKKHIELKIAYRDVKFW